MPLRGDSSLECQEARELTRAFLSGGGVLDRRADWRAHMTACKECDEHYRETVEMLSRLHRARRDGAPAEPEPVAESASALPPERRSLIAFAPPVARGAWRPRKRAAWLKLAIPFAALLVFGAIGLPGSEARPASALALQGAIEVDRHLIAVGDAELPFARGSRITAGAGARVRLSEGQTELVFEGEGMLHCESFGPLRVHLFGGRLHCRGACTVSSALGVVQASTGTLEIFIDEQGLHMLAGAPGSSFLDGSGRRALVPGQELLVAPPQSPDAQH